MSITIPPPVDAVVAAINGGDTKAFLAFFGSDGVVDDWGRTFQGPAAIRKWSDKELIGANGQLTVSSAKKTGNEITIVGDWQSTYFSGASRMIFTIDGAHVRQLRIVSA